MTELSQQGVHEENVCNADLGLQQEAVPIVYSSDVASGDDVQCVLRLRGGKGGFGSMLRAIGAQIEKTTNREACRDLSGRRLRDINEEKRLKNWIAQQADREREAAERRKKRLERLCAEPKHDFKDANYEKERAELTDKVSNAVDQGFKFALASGSGIGAKRKSVPSKVNSNNKKSCLWIDVDEEELSSSTDSDESDSGKAKVGSSTRQGVTRDDEVQIATTVDLKEEEVQVGKVVELKADLLLAAQAGPSSSTQETTTIT